MVTSAAYTTLEEANSSPADDATLVRRCGAGDRAALGALYDRFAPMLLAAAARVLGAEREAPDLVHDVFLEAWERARQYDPLRGSVTAWLLVRLRSRAFDRLGKVSATRTDCLDPGADVLVSARARAADSIDRLAVREALQRMEPGVREVLELTYFRGLTAKEIALQVGIPQGTVKSRLARGLGALGALLSETGGSFDAA